MDLEKAESRSHNLMDKNNIKTRLKIAKNKIRQSKNEPNSSNLGTAFKLSTELQFAVVGSIIGFILDSWFDTKPWLIIIFFCWRSSWNYKCY